MAKPTVSIATLLSSVSQDHRRRYRSPVGIPLLGQQIAWQNIPDWLTARPIAHRGLHNAAAGVLENTLSAVRAAVARNFAVEVDVQLSHDGEAMVFHDGNLARLTGHDVLIDNLTVEQLQSLPLYGTSDHIPTLWDVLQAIDGLVPIFIEIKNDDPIRLDNHLVERTIEVIHAYRGLVAVMSFDPDVLLTVKKRAPELPRASLPMPRPTWQTTAISHRANARAGVIFLHAAQTRPDFVAYRSRICPRPALAAARAFFHRPVLTWTVRTEQDRRIASTHADQIIFEGFDPSVA